MARFLREHAGFSEAEFSDFEKGELVAKVVKGDDKREVGVFGIVSINAPIGIVRDSFEKTITKEKKRNSSGFGLFSNPPREQEFDRISMKPKEIESLRKCKVSNCSLRLSASQISRFQKEVDWNAEDHGPRAQQLFRIILLEYLGSYMEGGDAALITYSDKKEAVNLVDEQRSLQKKLFWLDEFAPEFKASLNRYPDSGGDLESSFGWSRVKFGLKPVIMLTHTIKFNEKNNRFAVTLAKQIYSNHYMDSSLGLTVLIEISESGKEPETYLLFTNYTRAGAFGGTLGGIAKRVVEREAISKLELMLTNTRRYSEIALTGEQTKTEVSEKESLNQYFYWLLLAPFVCVLFFLIWKRVR